MYSTAILRRCLRPRQRPGCRAPARCYSVAPVVEIERATFYRQYPTVSASEEDAENAASNPPIFPDLSFTVPSNWSRDNRQFWAVVSPASLARTTFLQILDGQYICLPPTARTFPYLTAARKTKDQQLRTPEEAIRYVGFDAERGGLGGASLKGAYLSARYEARKEETDWSLRDYLEGNTELNALESGSDKVDKELLKQVVDDLNLEGLLDRPVSNLSNGQTRRARIAKTLLGKPDLVLLDGPFMGLDPKTVNMLSELLHDMAQKNAPRLVLSLRPEDHLPSWISHLVYIDRDLNILAKGRKEKVFQLVCDQTLRSKKRFPFDAAALQRMRDGSGSTSTLDPHENAVASVALSRDGYPRDSPPLPSGEPIIEMEGVKVSYGPSDSPTRQTVLGDWQQSDQSTPGLHWTISRGQRIGIFGPNGSGKTTLLSLITSDHPQAYSLPIKLFGKSRLPGPGEPGISIFELQKRMGHSSPEVHAFFPKHLTLRRVLESAWADAPLAKPKLSHANDRVVDGLLRWFAPELAPNGTSLLKELTAIRGSRSRLKKDDEAVKRRIAAFTSNTDDLDWADKLTFRDLSFSQQRLALFLRAIVASPDIVILDEAFGGMDETVRDKCHLFLAHGEKVRWHSAADVEGAATKKSEKAEAKQAAPTLKDSILVDEAAVVFEGLSEDQALLLISHMKEDVPGCVRQWICLPEPGDGKSARWGALNGPLELNPTGWDQIWGVSKTA